MQPYDVELCNLVVESGVVHVEDLFMTIWGLEKGSLVPRLYHVQAE